MLEEIKASELAPIPNVDNRNLVIGGVDNLSDVNTPGSGNSFALREGDVFEVPETPLTAKYDVREGQTNGAKICLLAVSLKRGAAEAKPTWISLNSIVKKDINGKSVNPEFDGLSYPEVIAKLQEGSWKATKATPIDVQAYREDGTRKIEVDENHVERPVTRKQNVCRVVKA